MRYYVNGKEIVFVKKIGEGEEADVYLTDDKQVAKIFKSDRRVDIRKPDLEFYKYLMNFDLSSFYFPTGIIYNEAGLFSGCTMNYFENGYNLSLSQDDNIADVIKKLRLLEEEIKFISDNHINAFDVKSTDIKVNDSTIGVFDIGLYFYSNSTDLLKDNLITINYALRSGLLWQYKDKMKQELKAYDLPYEYDDLDTSIVYLSDILYSETNKFKVKTISELKGIYKTSKFC